MNRTKGYKRDKVHKSTPGSHIFHGHYLRSKKFILLSFLTGSWCWVLVLPHLSGLFVKTHSLTSIIHHWWEKDIPKPLTPLTNVGTIRYDTLMCLVAIGGKQGVELHVHLKTAELTRLHCDLLTT